MGWLVSEWKRLRPFLALLDFAGPPATRIAWAVRICILSFAMVVLWRRIDTVTKPLLGAKPPPFIPTEEIDDYRFRLPDRTRREIFSEIAVAETAERKRAIEQNTWNGHLWSREDDRGHYERIFLRQLAEKHKLSLTQLYLVLDEGIRSRWPGPDGTPLPATTPALDMRWDKW